MKPYTPTEKAQLRAKTLALMLPQPVVKEKLKGHREWQVILGGRRG